MARLLAFDTSTETMAIALVEGEREWTLDLPGGAQASAALLPAIGALLSEAGLEGAQLDAVGFGRGPGAFTGLRTACAVAQGLAYGYRCPVLPIDTLEIVAQDAAARSAFGEGWVLMDARMGEIYAARYRQRPDAALAPGQGAARWQPLDACALYTLDALHARWRREPPAEVVGNALGAFGERLLVPRTARLDPDARPSAAALARCLRAAALRGDRVEPAQALPLYLRDKVALTTAEREAQRAAGRSSA